MAAVAIGLSAASVTACGGGASSPVVARVGGGAIEKAAVDHWTRVIERGGTPSGSLGGVGGTLRQRALRFLILSRWLSGEAARQGVSVSDSAIGRALTEHREVNGSAEFQAGLQSTGKTIADVRLEIGAELAAAAIRRKLAQRAAAVTQMEVVEFYEHNLQPFRHHEVRDVDLIENLPSPAAAQALVKRIGTGPGFSKLALHEQVAENPDRSLGTQTNAPIMTAIFAAPTGVVSRPVRLSNAWSVFIVRKIVPATAKPLTEVRGEIVEKLTALRGERFTAALLKEYEERWTAKTSCEPGYVVQGCAQYTGPVTKEEPPSL